MYPNRKEIFSKVVKAGRRTYFFDVRATKDNDHFITITESVKSDTDESAEYKKHKIFVYKEDFAKFKDGLETVLEQISIINQN